MTRKEKVAKIAKILPSLYLYIAQEFPIIISNPDSASPDEILVFNHLLAYESTRTHIDKETLKEQYMF